MTLGKRIKRIRTYRGMTQRELGIRLGYKESGADIRIAQYEMGHRKPKKDTLYKMAEILSVSPIQFIRPKQGSPEDLMQMFFWLEEENKAAIHVFKIEKQDGEMRMNLSNMLCHWAVTMRSHLLLALDFLMVRWRHI